MMQKSIISLFTFTFLLLTGIIGQHADCSNALLLSDTIYHTPTITGFGKHKEFDGNELDDKKLFEEEANSIWYVVDIEVDGIFTFDIITDNESDDWDFLLYKNQEMFCKKIKEKTIQPLRSNLSRSPITGLSLSAEEKFVSSGINNNYSKAVNVEEGEQYVLIVNNPKRAGGKHTLILHLPQKKEEAVVVKQPANTTIFKLEIKDAKTQAPVKSFASISGLAKKRVELSSASNYVDTLSKKNRDITIEASAKGYMLLSEAFKVSKTKSKHLVELFLEKIEAGKKVNLANIQFFGDQFKLLPSSQPSLNSLLLFMKSNPTVKIEVGGHVNGPGERNTKRYKELSYNRAYAVKAHLVKNGIEAKRIDFKGYGNSEMLYPEPKSAYQESANRRVEIKILSNEYNPGDRNFH